MINLVLFQVLIADCFGILEKFCGKIYKNPHQLLNSGPLESYLTSHCATYSPSKYLHTITQEMTFQRVCKPKK